MLLVLSILCVVVVGVILYGEMSWRSGARAMRDRLEACRRPMASNVFDSRELEGLPAPVQRYFRAVLKEGQPMVAGVRFDHVGQFNLSKTAERWRPFTSTQRVILQRPGFDWDARIDLFPGISVRVHDAYIAGEGVLKVSVLGLISLVNLRDKQDLARGELIRFFAEAAWYPTALLPSQGVRWEAEDEHSAHATLRDGDITVTVHFRFNGDDLIDTITAAERTRSIGESLPWQGRFWNHGVREGMRVPLEAEAAWVTPEGTKPYWRGKIEKIRYEFIS